MDVVERFVGYMLYIVIVGLLGGRLASSYNVCHVDKYTGQLKFHCYYCYSTRVCIPPYQETECNSVTAGAVMGNIARLFPDSVFNFDKTSRYACLALRAMRVDKTQFEIRGCTYFNFGKRLLNASFRYMKFYKHVNVPNDGNWEKHNRTYWNNTHFHYVFCWFCLKNYCNLKLFNKSTPQKHFQRPIYDYHTRTCIYLIHHNFRQFVRSCDENQVKGQCSSWVWPGNVYTTYHPHVTNILKMLSDGDTSPLHFDDSDN